MELYQLEYFLEAARQRNFTRAAQHLHLAQAALSEQIRKLEGELGGALFVRGRRESVLTQAGETLRAHAEILLGQAAAAKEAVRDLFGLRAGRLLVGAISSVSACLLPAAVAAFRMRYPLLDLCLLEGTTEQVSRWVEEGRVELGLVQLPAGPGSFRQTLLFAEPFVLLVPTGHRLARCRKAVLGELAQESFVFYRGRARDAAQAACRAAGFEPRVACESGELQTIRSLVAANLGLALLPKLAAGANTSQYVAVPLAAPVPEREVALLQRSGRELSPGAAEFRSLLRPVGVRK
jgi:LysR family hydrogen peroxide-inducible transcriptional activator